jgi:uncharacterized membrane protein affecting hemolysin expression
MGLAGETRLQQRTEILLREVAMNLPFHRRFILHHRDKIIIIKLVIIFFVICFILTTTLLSSKKAEAEEARHMAQLLQWHAEANLMVLLAGEPLVDKETKTAFIAKVESYP